MLRQMWHVEAFRWAMLVSPLVIGLVDAGAATLVAREARLAAAAELHTALAGEEEQLRVIAGEVATVEPEVGAPEAVERRLAERLDAIDARLASLERRG
jgi:hypothetical protein